MQIIKILLPHLNLFPLDYKIDSKQISVGDLIIVPFRNKDITAIVWEVNCFDSFVKNLKIIDSKNVTKLNIGNINIELIKKISSYYIAPLGSVARLLLPVDINEKPVKYESQNCVANNLLATLSYDQEVAVENINKANKPILLKGVTGSGKTEIYFNIVANAIKRGRQALILLPEVALSKQIINRFVKRFGFMPAIWNSTITKAKKKKILRGIIFGEVKVVIGARSSLFLPYKNLELIVVDEEHDLSYKQENGIMYNARDMAVLRWYLSVQNNEYSKVILVSATPSIETIYNVKQNKYEIIELKKRFSKATMPVVEIIDMKQSELRPRSWLSEKLIDEIKANAAKSWQCLLFLNRRGFAPLMLCKSCGYRFNCNKCSASMVIHKAKQKMECHHCGFVSKIHKICPECSEDDSLIFCGPGVERIYEEVIQIFPNLKVQIASKDLNPKEIETLIQEMESGNIDILIGTQIITKGYHFPKLALVGVVDADLGFIGGDLRSAEKMFQLLHQVSGRAGRIKDIQGKVFLQSYFAENKVLKAIISNDEDSFFNQEIFMRQEAKMPPFTKMAAINFTGKYQDSLYSTARIFAQNAPKAKVKILGPAEAFMFKLAGKYRYKIIIIVAKNFNVQKYIKLWLGLVAIPKSIQVKIDIDPYNTN